MSDNPRPQLYGAPLLGALADRAEEPGDGDFRWPGSTASRGTADRRVALPAPRRGDLIAVPASGGYTLAMSSNYNGVPRPAAVSSRAGDARVSSGARRSTTCSQGGRASPRSRPRTRCEAKCSWAIETSPFSHPSPSSRSNGKTAPSSTASSEKSASSRSSRTRRAPPHRRAAGVHHPTRPGLPPGLPARPPSAPRVPRVPPRPRKRRSPAARASVRPGARPRSSRADSRSRSGSERAGRTAVPRPEAGRSRRPSGARARRFAAARRRSSPECTEFGQRFDNCVIVLYFP